MAIVPKRQPQTVERMSGAFFTFVKNAARNSGQSHLTGHADESQHP
jgi:hypothetical protein